MYPSTKECKKVTIFFVLVIRGDNMKKFLALFLVLILFCACAQEPKDLTENYTKRIEDLTGTPSEKFEDAQYEFAVELLKENFKEQF